MTSKKQETIKKNRKLVIVGHPRCGKTTLLRAFEHKPFVANYYPETVYEIRVPVQFDGETIHISLFDTASAEDFDRLRPLSYPHTKIVIICFSVDNPVSATRVIETWAPEIRHYLDRCPVILVACKKELRTDSETLAELGKLGEKPVTSEIGRQIAAEIRADAYIECSSKTGEGVEDLLNHAARLSLTTPSHRTTTCKCILQ